jgi:hypothetical protein
MGITVHWEGSVKDKETADKIISYAKFFADSLGWPNKYRKFPSIAYAYDTGLKDRDGTPILSVFNQEIDPKDPMHTESICISFYPWKGEYKMKDFCKTQVFSDKQMPNLIAHQLLISMLQTIKNTWMPNLEIYDEGKFLKTNNFNTLMEAHGRNLQMINDLGGVIKAMGPDIELFTPAKKSFIENLGKDKGKESTKGKKKDEDRKRLKA